MLGVCSVTIPNVVDDEEIVLRTIFHPMNFRKNGKTLSPNFMTPPARPDEDDSNILSNKLSVTRYIYAGIDFCKAHGRLHSNPDVRRSYYGFAMFVVESLRKLGVDVVAAPTDDNPAHANIVLPFEIKYGEPKSSEFSLLCRKLAESAKIFKEEDEEGHLLHDNDFSGSPLKGICTLSEE